QRAIEASVPSGSRLSMGPVNYSNTPRVFRLGLLDRAAQWFAWFGVHHRLASRACHRWPAPRVFHLLQLTLTRLCRSVATGRLVRFSCAAMHRSDSAILRFRLAMVFFVRLVEPAISPVANRAVSRAFTASRFLLS